MSHINSYNSEVDGKIYLYTDQPNPPPESGTKKIRLGGPYPTEKAATAASKDVSRAVGKHGSVKDYKKYLKRKKPVKKMIEQYKKIVPSNNDTFNRKIAPPLGKQYTFPTRDVEEGKFFKAVPLPTKRYANGGSVRKVRW